MSNRNGSGGLVGVGNVCVRGVSCGWSGIGVPVYEGGGDDDLRADSATSD